MREYREKYPLRSRAGEDGGGGVHAAAGYDAHREHHRVFYEAVRSRKKPVEDAVFGFRAAGPALLANTSCYEKRECRWNAGDMKVEA